jgi:hypothetical protein
MKTFMFVSGRNSKFFSASMCQKWGLKMLSPKFLLRLAGLSAALLFLGWIYYTGYNAGMEKIRLENVIELNKMRVAAAELEAKTAEKERARLSLEQQNQLLSLELENAAISDPHSGNNALGADSVRRINKR